MSSYSKTIETCLGPLDIEVHYDLVEDDDGCGPPSVSGNSMTGRRGSPVPVFSHISIDAIETVRNGLPQHPSTILLNALDDLETLCLNALKLEKDLESFFDASDAS